MLSTPAGCVRAFVCTNITDNIQGWTYMPVRMPRAGNLVNGLVNFQTCMSAKVLEFQMQNVYHACWAGKRAFQLITFIGYQPDWLVRKLSIKVYL